MGDPAVFRLELLSTTIVKVAKRSSAQTPVRSIEYAVSSEHRGGIYWAIGSQDREIYI